MTIGRHRSPRTPATCDTHLVRDWIKWHEDYEIPGTPLSRRLDVVRSRLHEALDAVGPGPALLSLCAGDGRDVISVLRNQPREMKRVVLVELDQTLAESAEQAAYAAGLSFLEVRRRDAGIVSSFIDVLPVDVLMLCGIFGNVEHTRIKDVVDFVPCLVRQGGYVIWTRGGSEPDRRPEIRRWFTEAGLLEISFAGAPEPYGVGLCRMTRPSLPTDHLPATLFRFTS